MKMGVRRKDVILLLVVLIIFAAIAYYFLRYEAIQSELESKRLDVEKIGNKILIVRQTIESENFLDARMQEIEDKIKSYAGKYYAEIKQENEIITIGSLYSTSAIDIDSMGFNMEVTKLSQLAKKSLEKINFKKDEVPDAGQAPEVPAPEAPAAPENPDNKPTDGAEKTSATGDKPVESENPENKTDVEKPEAGNTDKDKMPGGKFNPNLGAPIETDSLLKTSEAEDQLFDQDVVLLSTTMAYKGTFDDLEKFMSNIYSYSKYIILENIDISSDGKGELSGQLTIAMYGLPKISEIFGAEDRIYYEGISRRETEADVYTPYETFKDPTPPIEIPDSFTPEQPKVNPFAVQEDEVAKTIYGFEGTDYFFAPGSENVDGSVDRVFTKKQGTYAAKLSYQFADKSDDNIASLVFDKNPLIVNEIADRMEMIVYLPNKSKNGLYAALIDQFSQEYIVEFNIEYVNDTESEDTNWAIAKAELPSSITSPFAVERVFVHAKGDAQDLSGSIILDNFRIVSKGKVANTAN